MRANETDQAYWTRKRLSRRQALRLGAIGGLSAATMLGCQTQSQPATPAPSQAPSSTTPAASPTSIASSLPPLPVYSKRYPEVSQLLLKYNWKNLPDRKNPKPPKTGGVYNGSLFDLPHFDFTVSMIQQTYCNALLFMNQLVMIGLGPESDLWASDPEPDLAEKWEIPDPTTYVFKLRQGVKFHNVAPVNGRELTAEDLKYCFGVYMDPKIPQSNFLTVVDRIEAPDKYTFKITTKEPYAPMVKTLANRIFPIFAREVREAPGDLMRSLPIGTGPYVFKELTPKVKMTMVKNPEYFRKDKYGNRLPYVDGSVRIMLADVAAREAAFRSKQVEYWGPSTAEQLDAAMKAFPDASVVVNPAFAGTSNQVFMRQDKEPWKDVRVRRALSMSVDRTEIIDTVYKGSATPTSPVPQYFTGDFWARTVEQQGQYYQYNPTAAKQLLAEAGYPNGLKTTIITREASGANIDQLLFIQQAWKKVGIDVEIKNLDLNAWAKQYEGGDFDLAWDPFHGIGGFEVDAYVAYRMYSKSTGNHHRLNDPKLDDLILKQRKTLNQTERFQILKELEKYEYDQCYRLYFVNNLVFQTMHPYVHNLAHHIQGAVDSGASWQSQYYWLDENAPRRPPV